MEIDFDAIFNRALEVTGTKTAGAEAKDDEIRRAIPSKVWQHIRNTIPRYGDLDRTIPTDLAIRVQSELDLNK